MKVTNYEISKKLTEIGFDEITDFYFRKVFERENQTNFNIQLLFDCGFFGGGSKVVESYGKINPQSIDHFRDDYIFEPKIKTYHLETILGVLPVRIDDKSLTIWENHSFMYQDVYEENGDLWVNKKENESLADTAARLLILLHEKGIIQVNNK